MTGTPPPARIVILGGGTAGWMAACSLARAWGGGRVTLIESPAVGIIGVGEGSTPQLRDYLSSLGLAEEEWMPRCNATYKNGIRFNGWSARKGFESYYHPFVTSLDRETQGAFEYHCLARRTARDVAAHPDAFFLPTRLSDERKAPLPAENFPFDIPYGYHFDAHLIGEMLRDHALSLGVTHLQRHVEGVALAADGSVESLVLRDDGPLAADLFVDCSGFRSAILQQALGVKFVSYADNLFNDRAVVMPTPADPTGTNPHTIATALSAGWAWDIPLTNRTGNGYVYSSRYLDKDDAEAELRAHLGLTDADVPVRHLEMKVGRVERVWEKNCVAVGLSQGFIEPLEATALHLTQATIDGFIEAWETGQRQRYNQQIADRFEGIRDYIVAHYRLNQVATGPGGQGREAGRAYWHDARSHDHLSDDLKALMTAWFTAADLGEVIRARGLDRYYSSLSWHCLFAGYGTFPQQAQMRAPEAAFRPADMARIADFLRRCALNFTDHKKLLDDRRGSVDNVIRAKI